MPHGTTARGHGPAYLALTVSACLWGSGFLFGKIALEQLGVGHMLLYRFLFGSLALLPLLVRRRARPRRADLALLGWAALLGIPVQYIVQFEGLARTTVSHASLMIGAVPLVLAAAAVVFHREHLDRGGWLLLAVSAAGAALIAAGAGRGGARLGLPSALGDSLVLLSILAGTFWVLLSKRLMGPAHGYHAFEVNAWIVILGTVMLALWVLAREGAPPVHLSARTWLAVAAPGLLTTALGSFLWNWGLTRVPATRAAAFVNIDPVVGALLGVVILGERLGPSALVGGVLILGAALRFTLREHLEETPAPAG